MVSAYALIDIRIRLVRYGASFGRRLSFYRNFPSAAITNRAVDDCRKTTTSHWVVAEGQSYERSTHSEASHV